ncbi:MAG: hypothetical protein V5A68_05950 [Candidatus Thermoplasmatota archaeon]
MDKKNLTPQNKLNSNNLGDEEVLDLDDQLAIDIIHKFNIPRNTVENMPAFKEHISTLFLDEEK